MPASPTITRNEFKGITHTLGLTGKVKLCDDTTVSCEGFNFKAAHDFSTTEYFRIRDDVPNSYFLSYQNQEQNLLQLETIRESFSELEHGQSISILTGWEKHAISISLIKEKDKLHIIINNRGQQLYEQIEVMFQERTVEVFTLDANTLATKETFDRVLNTCVGQGTPQEDGTVRSSFVSLLDHLNGLNSSNDELSNNLNKSFQKVRNCTIANQNITWHISLASDYMIKNPGTSFTEAYKETRPEYHQMREASRIYALKELIDSRDDFSEGWENLLEQILLTLVLRQIKGKQFSTISRVCDELENEPQYLKIIKEALGNMHTANADIIKAYFNIYKEIEITEETNLDGSSNVAIVINKINAEPVSVCINAIIQSGLKVNDPSDVPVILQAMLNGDTETVRILINAVINSDLEPTQKMKLIGVKDSQGMPGICLADRYDKVIEIFTSEIFKSDLAHDIKMNLLLEKTPNGNPWIYGTILTGHGEIFTKFINDSIEHGLNIDVMIERLTTRNLKDTFVICSSMKDGDSKIFETFSKAVMGSNLEPNQKNKLLMIVDPDSRIQDKQELIQTNSSVQRKLSFTDGMPLPGRVISGPNDEDSIAQHVSIDDPTSSKSPRSIKP